MNEVNFITQKKKELFWPLVFLWVVLALSIILFLFNFSLDYSTKDLNKKIIERTNDINVLKNDPKIQVYSLIEANKSTIINLEKRSTITKYINHLQAISKKYDIIFEDFAISWWSVNVKATINSSDKWIAYVKTRDFIKNYRVTEGALFKLDFINSIEWMDSMKFNVVFNIK